jgi:hypothetical protein
MYWTVEGIACHKRARDVAHLFVRKSAITTGPRVSMHVTHSLNQHCSEDLS